MDYCPIAKEFSMSHGLITLNNKHCSLWYSIVKFNNGVELVKSEMWTPGLCWHSLVDITLECNRWIQNHTAKCKRHVVLKLLFSWLDVPSCVVSVKNICHSHMAILFLRQQFPNQFKYDQNLSVVNLSQSKSLTTYINMEKIMIA